MGLDQTLNWICKPPKAYVSRLRKKDLRERMVLYGIEYMSEEDYSLPAYKYIRKYMIPEEVYISEMNWELLKYDCGVPYDVQICGLGPGYVLIGKAANDVDVKKFDINPYDKRYEKLFLDDSISFIQLKCIVGGRIIKYRIYSTNHTRMSGMIMKMHMKWYMEDITQ